MSTQHSSGLTLTIGTILTVLTLTVAGVTSLNATEHKANQAAREVEGLKSEIKDIKAELAKQREMLAEVKGDSRAILQLLKMRKAGEND